MIYNRVMITTIEIAKRIVEFLAKSTTKSLERNHKVLKLLNRLGIGKLEDTFGSIYAHALVEYAVDAKSPDMTRLFAAKKK